MWVKARKVVYRKVECYMVKYNGIHLDKLEFKYEKVLLEKVAL